MALLLLLIGLIKAGAPPSVFYEKQVFMGCFSLPLVNAHFVRYRPGGILSLNIIKEKIKTNKNKSFLLSFYHRFVIWIRILN
jgi:hypothetical protein